MKSAIEHKLGSRDGMSLLFAALVFLLCALAGAAAITAASANSGRHSHLREDQQKYYLVTSAAKLARDALCFEADGSGLSGDELAFTASATLTRTETWTTEEDGTDAAGNPIYKTTYADTYAFAITGDSGYSPPIYAPGMTVPDPYPGKLGSWLKAGLLKLFYVRDILPKWGSIQKVIDADPGASTLEWKSLTAAVGASAPEVKWELAMDENYAFTATFWLGDGTTKEYETGFYLPAEYNTDTDTDITSETAGNTETRTTVTTITTTVKWPQGGAVFTQVKGK